jgi:hypothetical protein
MKRTIGTTRITVAGMVLMGAALGMFGDVRLAATNQFFPRVPRTEQEQVTRGGTDLATPVTKNGFSVVARRRSSEGDPCIPTAPGAFFAHGPVIC